LPINQLYDRLLAENRITRLPARIWSQQPAWYIEGKSCDFHSNELGHDIFKCPVLRRSIEDLIEQGYLKFSPLEPPNTIVNPLPKHQGPVINMVSQDQSPGVFSFRDLPCTKLELLQALLRCGHLPLLPF
jgi:hypothetical protein